MPLLRLIGDIHGDLHQLNEIKQTAHRYDLTIQLGDFGIGFGAEDYLDSIDSDRVKILHGNHDNPTLLEKYPHNLGRYGIYDFFGHKIFYIAGAWSIDQEHRTIGLSWWDNEELGFKEQNDCLDLWEAECGNIELVLSHDCPINVGHAILGYMPHQTNTGRLLYEMFKFHEPPVWYFGHWHKHWSRQIGKTKFMCLNINQELVLNF